MGSWKISPQLEMERWVVTNLAFGEWTRVFTDARLCKAVVDRLTFGAHIIETGTDSWRLRRSLVHVGKRGARS
jgi:DNA replication protein DnaC